MTDEDYEKMEEQLEKEIEVTSSMARKCRKAHDFERAISLENTYDHLTKALSHIESAWISAAADETIAMRRK